jgi:hypothetical protein
MCSGGGTGDVYEKLLFWRVTIEFAPGADDSMYQLTITLKIPIKIFT